MNYVELDDGTVIKGVPFDSLIPEHLEIVDEFRRKLLRNSTSLFYLPVSCNQ
jgi:hypothetical protein